VAQVGAESALKGNNKGEPVTIMMPATQIDWLGETCFVKVESKQFVSSARSTLFKKFSSINP
jgi:hypothetical protein